MRTTRTRWKKFCATAAAVAVVGSGAVALVPAPAMAAEPDAFLNVKVVGDKGRGVEGVTVGAFAGGSNAPQASLFGGSASTYVTPAATCVTDDTGSCSIGVATSTAGYWVAPIDAPSDWFVTTHVSTGSTSGTTQRPYAIHSGAVTAGAAVDIASRGTSATTSSGAFMVSRANPIVSKCGMRVAVVMDVSASIDGGEMTRMKQAANGFVDALTGTGSTISVVTFGSSANVLQSWTSVATPQDAAAVKTTITNYSQPSGQWTNWDRGLGVINGDPDVVLMLTDGDPTTSGTGNPSGTAQTRFVEIEHGVTSANTLKSNGARVVAVGIGSAVSSSTGNLAAISGPSLGSDYFLSDFTQLENALKQWAAEACTGTMTIVKRVLDVGETAVADADVPPQEWRFQTQFNGAGATNHDTNAQGTFEVSLDAIANGTSVSVTERQQHGYELVKTDGTAVAPTGSNAVCTVGGRSVAVTDTTDGFTLAGINKADDVRCTVYNRAMTALSVTPKKVWVVQDENGDEITRYTDPAQAANDGLRADPLLTFDGVAIHPVAWDQQSSPFYAGDVVNLDEANVVVPAGCTLDGVQGVGDHTVAEGSDNVYTVTNTVSCARPQLTLVKEVVNDAGGVADSTHWTLSAAGADGTDVLSGVHDATGPALTTKLNPGHYSLAELGNTPQAQDYTQVSLKCVDAAAGEIPVTDDAIDLAWGNDVTCTFVNTDDDPRLTLVKVVGNNHGGVAIPEDWTLTATQQGDGGATYTGRTGDGWTVGAGTYSVAEDDLPGYQQVSKQCTSNREGRDAVMHDGDVVLAWGDDVTCTFTNVDVAPRIQLVKELEQGQNGGLETPGDWTLTADRTAPLPGSDGATTAATTATMPGDSTTSTEVAAGEYALTEDGPDGYAQTGLRCFYQQEGPQNGQPAQITNGNSVTLLPGDDVQCIFTNTSDPAYLTLVKQVANEHGGTAVPGDFFLMAQGDLSAVTGFGDSDTILHQAVKAGWYTLDEASMVSGYGGTWTSLTCESNYHPRWTVGDDKLLLAPGEDATCTFVNTDQPTYLLLQKSLDRSMGGPATATDWLLTADGAADYQMRHDANVATAADAVEVAPGVYDLSEAGPEGYRQTGLRCTGGGSLDGTQLTIGLGERVTCTFTNVYNPPKLTLEKEVVNQFGGTAKPGDFALSAVLPDSQPTTMHHGESAYVTADRPYALTEAGPDGYRQTGLRCTGADGTYTFADGKVTLGYGADVTCTFTNTDTLRSQVLADDRPTGWLASTGLDTRTFALIAAGVLGLGALAVVVHRKARDDES